MEYGKEIGFMGFHVIILWKPLDNYCFILSYINCKACRREKQVWMITNCPAMANTWEVTRVLPEAKILAVADVFEAMISHRPYRPALGLEATLDELISHRGIRYDAEVVDAVVRLIKDKGYQIPE